MKVHVLHLPEHEFTSATGLYIASALNRVLNGNYSYGEQLLNILVRGNRSSGKSETDSPEHWKPPNASLLA